MKANSKTNQWLYAYWLPKKVHGYNWLNTYGWNQSAGDGTFYNLHQFGKHEVLTVAGGYNVSAYGHYYRSAKVAKQLERVKYSNFVYY
ncbi:hypothetical protein [Nicoliella lavandulae]|uniref:Uncharacterized protein n=1 Tax=Nicoliella lavandulae TaxID=3082954 RepID=A0ABU8SME5_9LACO